MSYQVPLGYVPISSGALRPLGAAYIPILLSERAYTAYAPHYDRMGGRAMGVWIE